ncbi:Acyl-CoA dehydrogenase [Salmonella enterica subsp. enterica serovar Senftenberg str. A4-543]|uniref:Acyl-CoA dehydrogenase n=1 Tax=Salmonella enterica subsp. enterica serovar Senftenberg str. A4-543 TaxID=913082 RepID=G5R0V9_SALSE|nr:Acyl-CoA dehydrogenase [Salmonella enterica subsp. enterica serovar Senftenberg str. A4-543]
MEVIDDAIQIMGGLGYTDEARVSRFWRDVRCERPASGAMFAAFAANVSVAARMKL